MKLLLVFVTMCAGAWAQFPDGPGKAEMMKVCSGCHEVERSASLRQDRAAWKGEVDKMVALGAKGTEAEFAAVVDYLAKVLPADEVPRLNVNTASQIELES